MKIIRPVNITDAGSFTRATTGTYYDINGVRQTAAINTPRFSYDPANLSAGPFLLLEPAATNLLLNSATVASQGISTSAGTYTLSFDGSGSVTLSGAATGTLVGGTYRSSLTFTSVGGTVTLTVSGTCTNGQLEAGSVATSYIATTGATATRAADVNTTMLISNVPETDYAVWSSGTSYTKGQRVLDLTNHLIYEAITGASAVVTITNSSPGVVNWANHGQANGTPVLLTTTGTLPSPFVASTTYYIVNATTNSFQLSATFNGTPINTTTAGSGTHTASITNLNRAVTDTSAWVLVGKDNRWSMFDQSVSSQTSQATNIIVAISPGTRFDSIVGMNISATSVTINIVDPVYGNVYSRNIAMVSDSSVSDLWEYFYEPVVPLTDFLKTDVPIGFSSSTITLCFSSSTTAAVGGVVIGLSKEIGVTVEGAKVGIIDYGVKTKDAFGNYSITSRGYSKRADFTIKVNTAEVDSLHTLFASYRSIPVVYVGSNESSDMQFQSSVIYGYYKDFSMEVSYPPLSTCSLQVEGLT